MIRCPGLFAFGVITMPLLSVPDVSYAGDAGTAMGRIERYLAIVRQYALARENAPTVIGSSTVEPANPLTLPNATGWLRAMGLVLVLGIDRLFGVARSEMRSRTKSVGDETSVGA
jgi:hypothetical protein